MEKHQHGFLLIFFIVISLGLMSFISCIIAEFKKAKEDEMKLDNKLCYLPESEAFSYGIAALVCLIIAQIIGNLLICSNFCFRKDEDSSKAKKPKIATAFLVFSWICCGVGVIILSGSISMSRKQMYGKGWLDQKCYVVRDGVFIGSGFIALISIAATLVTAFFSIATLKTEQPTRIHAQLV